jgi:hypothetical protein
MRTLVRHLKRSPRAVVTRAAQHGLPFGVPQGKVCVEDLVRATGITHSTIARFLRLTGVPSTNLPSAPYGSKQRVYVMDTDTAHKACAQYLLVREVLAALTYLKRAVKDPANPWRLWQYAETYREKFRANGHRPLRTRTRAQAG